MTAPHPRRLTRLLAAVAVAAAAGGCVERRFVVTSNAPGAQVYINNAPVGPSPSDATWEYTGKYEFRLVAPGYEPLRQVVEVRPRWYEYAPLDFFFEAVWPLHIEDVRRYHFDLTPAAPVRTDELLDAANGLRERGRSLPPPQEPDHQRAVPLAPPPDLPPGVP
jgi:hypothetical protein